MCMKKRILLSITCSSVCVATAQATTGPVIDPSFNSASVLIGLGPQDEKASDTDTADAPVAEATVSDPMYLRFGVGANFMADSDIKDTPLSVSWNTGLDLNLAFGIALMQDLSIEFEIGMQYNSAKEVNFPGFGVGNVDADLYQVPLMGNLQYDFHLGESLTLGVMGGVGAQYSSLSGDGSTETTWTFRYQVGVDLLYKLSATSSVGAYFRYAGTPSVGFDDFSFDSFQNFAVGGMFKFEF